MCLSGCVQTSLTVSELSPDVFRLAALSQQPLALEVTALADPHVGRQFGFGILPLGSVSVPKSQTLLYRVLYQVAAERGFKPVTSSGDGTVPSLKVIFRNASVMAYDLLVQRKVVIKTELEATLTSSGGLIRFHQRSRKRYSRFVSLPFAKELSAALETTLRLHLEEFFDDLERRIAK